MVRALADPVGQVTERWTRPNGMTIERVRVPLGVVGIIYESRPNVTADAGALCLKAGNAAILRGGSESHRSNRAIHAALVEGLRAAGLPEAAIQLVPTRDRAAVGMMLAGLDGAIDVIVPRGGKSLVARVQAEARVPVFAHLEGICHVYVDKAAKLDMAKTIVLNAKMRRTGVCGAAETLLVDRAAAPTHLKPLVTMLLDAGCEVRGDEATRAVDARVKPASEEDWSTEYLDADHRRQGGRRRRRRDRAYRALRLAPHRFDRHRGPGRGGEIPARGRFGDRAAQRLDPVRRRRRVRLRRRDRHRHRPLPRARPGRRRAAHQLQVPRARLGADQAVSAWGGVPARRPTQAYPRGLRQRGRDDARCAGRVMPSSRVSLPPHAPGMRIGLFGGTFDPPHEAHRAACLIAMKRLELDRVWWLVTPGNPLKDTRGLAPARRAHRGRPGARASSAHRRHRRRGGDRHPLHLRDRRLSAPHCPGVRFVWIMGADNLRSFHRWQKWRGIAAMVPIAVVDRLGPSLYATASAAGQALARARIPETAAKSLADRKPPAWVYLHGLKSPLSSTALRAARHKSDAKVPHDGDCGTATG